MKPIFALFAVVALAACGSGEPAEPVPSETAAPVVVEPTMPPPDAEAFAAAYAEGCPEAEPVSTSLCKSLGLGQEGFTCDYGLGDDEYRRNTATLVPRDGQWTLADPAKTCAAEDAA